MLPIFRLGLPYWQPGKKHPCNSRGVMGQVYSKRRHHFCSKFFLGTMGTVACECRRISGGHFSPPKNTVCEAELQNDFCDITTFVCFLANHVA